MGLPDDRTLSRILISLLFLMVLLGLLFDTPWSELFGGGR